MGVRENKVETYLDEQVVKLGGITRKWVSPGHDGVPDRIVFIKGYHTLLVEVKTEDGVYKPGQEREHKRLQDNGALVFTVFGHAGVDLFISHIKSKL